MSTSIPFHTFPIDFTTTLTQWQGAPVNVDVCISWGRHLGAFSLSRSTLLALSRLTNTKAGDFADWNVFGTVYTTEAWADSAVREFLGEAVAEVGAMMNDFCSAWNDWVPSTQKIADWECSVRTLSLNGGTRYLLNDLIAIVAPALLRDDYEVAREVLSARNIIVEIVDVERVDEVLGSRFSDFDGLKFRLLNEAQAAALMRAF